MLVVSVAVSKTPKPLGRDKKPADMTYDQYRKEFHTLMKRNRPTQRRAKDNHTTAKHQSSQNHQIINRERRALRRAAIESARKDLRWLMDLLDIIDNEPRADNIRKLCYMHLADANRTDDNALNMDTIVASREQMTCIPLLWAGKHLSAYGAANCRTTIIETMRAVHESAGYTFNPIDASDHQLMAARLEKTMAIIDQLEALACRPNKLTSTTAHITIDNTVAGMNEENSREHIVLSNVGVRLVEASYDDIVRKLMAISGMVSACRTCIVNTITHDRYKTMTAPLTEPDATYEAYETMA